jgi:hypothetical protein
MPSAPLRLTVLGQALIQHDPRASGWPNFAALAEMFGRADACFTDLETAIRNPSAEAPTREGVFLHAADPVVLDCLRALSVSLLATANNPGCTGSKSIGGGRFSTILAISSSISQPKTVFTMPRCGTAWSPNAVLTTDGSLICV